jgi:hypothetical protein
LHVTGKQIDRFDGHQRRAPGVDQNDGHRAAPPHAF